MNAPPLVEQDIVEPQRLTSDAYTLIIRQGPERAKAFAGPKEKDRKPVDPPPIVQLRIRDPDDPAQNYLQSPYFFMVVNLQDADPNLSGPNAAAQQGTSQDAAIESALGGSLVSSLHRLKDVDNTDGGFFVFPDLSIKREGEYRLRFSLFEMRITRVAYIKSTLSDPFTAYTPRAFPGMSESTFLSRSFGDQGVKLRIRKEPRVLGKRAAPSDIFPAETPHGHSRPSQNEYPTLSSQITNERGGGYSSPGYRDSYDDLAFKRQRLSIDPHRRTAYDQDQQVSQRSQMQPRESFGQYPARDMTLGNRGSYYPQGLPSVSGSSVPDYSLGHQRTNSSSTSSSFISPHTDYSSYSLSTPGPSLYQQPASNAYQYPNPYSQMQYGSSQSRPLTLPTSIYRTLPSSLPSQTDQTRSYSMPSQTEQPRSTHTRSYDTDDLAPLDRGYGAGNASSRPDYYNTQPQLLSTSFDRTLQSQARTLPDPSQTSASVLPPLQSTLPSSQSREPLPSYSFGGTSGVESQGSSQLQGSTPSGQENQNYLSQYRGT